MDNCPSLESAGAETNLAGDCDDDVEVRREDGDVTSGLNGGVQVRWRVQAWTRLAQRHHIHTSADDEKDRVLNSVQ